MVNGRLPISQLMVFRGAVGVAESNDIDSSGSTRIDAQNLFPKTIFALFGHTPEYKQLAMEHPIDDRVRQSAQKEFFRDELREVCSLAHQEIVSGDYDRSKYPWIMPSDGVIGDFPKKFTAISDQLSKDTPSIDSKKSKVFPRAFAGICAVLKDILSMKEYGESRQGFNIRDICGLNDGEYIPDNQSDVLRVIHESLLSRSLSQSPNWPITFENRKVTIKSDNPKYFLHSNEIQHIGSTISGKYFSFRRAFVPNPNGKNFIREHVSISTVESGLLFRWTTRVGPNEIHGTFRGCLLAPKRSLWFLGYDEQVMPRMWGCSLELSDFLSYCKQSGPNNYMVCGTVMSSMPDERRPTPETRTFYMRSVVTGEIDDLRFENGAAFLTQDELERQVNPQAFLHLVEDRA